MKTDTKQIRYEKTDDGYKYLNDPCGVYVTIKPDAKVDDIQKFNYQNPRVKVDLIGSTEFTVPWFNNKSEGESKIKAGLYALVVEEGAAPLIYIISDVDHNKLSKNKYMFWEIGMNIWNKRCKKEWRKTIRVET